MHPEGEGYLAEESQALELDHTKSGGRSLIGETRWRACEEAVAAAAGPKRREPIAAEARPYEKRRPLDTFGVGAEACKANPLSFGEFDPGSGRTLAACLIHASRADRIGACSYLVSGGRVSNTWATCPQDRDNSGKPELIPDNTEDRMVFG